MSQRDTYRAVPVSASLIWIGRNDGKIYALSTTCTHLGCSYAFDKAKKTFFCPCHRGQFDVKTGKVLAGPPPRPAPRRCSTVLWPVSWRACAS